MKNYLAILTILTGMILILIGPADAQDDGEDYQWTSVRRLSSLRGEVVDSTMVVDDEGTLHVFWIESGLSNERSVINYSRFDGMNWTEPIAVFVSWPEEAIGSVAASVGNDNRINLAWSDGRSGPIRYSTTTNPNSLSVQEWSKPVRVNLPAVRVKLHSDSRDVLHLFYSDFYSETPGIYYITSPNFGKAWSYQVQLDPKLPGDGAPSWIDTAMDAEEGLHIVWTYQFLADGTTASTSLGRWIRYTNSYDLGQTWNEPMTIDLGDETAGQIPPEDPEELRMADPGIAAYGENVHIIWAGTAEVEREHRFSIDRGQSWSETERVFGDLQGQSGGDGLAFDGVGRLHFAGQLRWPQAIYHAIWQNFDWSNVGVVYEIREDSTDEFKGRIHAHNVRLAILNGNILVMTFTTSPSEQQSVLYTMNKVLEGVPAYERQDSGSSLPAVTSTEAVESQVVAPESLLPTPTDGVDVDLEDDVSPPSSPSLSLWLGAVPGLLLAGVVAAYRRFRRR